MKSLLSVKHDKLNSGRVKRRHRKFLKSSMKGSYVDEFCHAIERSSLNIVTTYFNNDYHLIIITNDTSQISLKD